MKRNILVRYLILMAVLVVFAGAAWFFSNSQKEPEGDAVLARLRTERLISVGKEQELRQMREADGQADRQRMEVADGQADQRRMEEVDGQADRRRMEVVDGQADRRRMEVVDGQADQWRMEEVADQAVWQVGSGWIQAVQEVCQVPEGGSV